MAKTIIQTIGPLYGEDVNGTVFGRPNGSIYIPSSNTITLTIPDDLKYIRVNNQGRFVPTNSAGQLSSQLVIKVVAQAQDVQAYIAMSVVDSDDVIVGDYWQYVAGDFNNAAVRIVGDSDGKTLVNGDTYAIVATLFSANGVAIATDKVTVTGVVVA